MEVDHHGHDNGSPSDSDMDVAGRSNISKLLDDASEESNMIRRNDHSHSHSRAGVGLRRSGRRRTLSAKYSEHLKMQNLLKQHQRLRLSSSSEEDGSSSGGSSYKDSDEEAKGKENRVPNNTNTNSSATCSAKKRPGLNERVNNKEIGQNNLSNIGINKSDSPKKVTGKRTREEESTPSPPKSNCDDDENDCTDIDHGLTRNNLSPTSSISSASHGHDEEEGERQRLKDGVDPQTSSTNKKSRRVEGRNSDDGSSSVTVSSLSDDSSSSSTHCHGTDSCQNIQNVGIAEEEEEEHQNTTTNDGLAISSLCKDVTKKAKLDRTSSTTSSSSSSWSLLSDASCLSSISESSNANVRTTPKKSDGGGVIVKKKKQQRKQKWKQKSNFTPRRSARLSAIMNKSDAVGDAGDTITPIPDKILACDKGISTEKGTKPSVALKAHAMDSLGSSSMVQKGIQKDSSSENGFLPIERKSMSLTEINADGSAHNNGILPIAESSQLHKKDAADRDDDMPSDLKNCKVGGLTGETESEMTAPAHELISTTAEETPEQRIVLKKTQTDSSMIAFVDTCTFDREKVQITKSAGTTKSKRRRRSSLGLHVGGMVTLKDIEAFRKDAVEKKRDRTIRRRSLNVSTQARDENTSTCRTKEIISTSDTQNNNNCTPMDSHQLGGKTNEEAEPENRPQETALCSKDDSPTGGAVSPLETASLELKPDLREDEPESVMQDTILSSMDEKPVDEKKSSLENTPAEIESELEGAKPEIMIRETTSSMIDGSPMDGAESPREEASVVIESELESAKPETMIREIASNSTDDSYMHGAGYTLEATSDEIKSEMRLLFPGLEVVKKVRMRFHCILSRICSFKGYLPTFS